MAARSTQHAGKSDGARHESTRLAWQGECPAPFPWFHHAADPRVVWHSAVPRYPFWQVCPHVQEAWKGGPAGEPLPNELSGCSGKFTFPFSVPPSWQPQLFVSSFSFFPPLLLLALVPAWLTGWPDQISAPYFFFSCHTLHIGGAAALLRLEHTKRVLLLTLVVA
jgi:hypothetical protein